MNKKLISLLVILALMLTMTAAASADHLSGKAGWLVEFVKGDKMVSNFTSNDIADAASNLQPGDDITFTITMANTSGKTIDWYMLNEILKSLEDTGKHNPSGGAYSYLLTYRSSAGTVTTLYDSDTVGGEQSVVNTAIEGLKEVDSNLKSYMYLETMQSGRTGIVTLKVSLDGESQGNVYQESIADLRLRFAAEVTPGYNIIKTGDDSIKLMPFYIGMVAAGLLFIVFAATGLREKKKKGGESK